MTEDEIVAETNKEMNTLLPFAVVGSNEFVKVGSKSSFESWEIGCRWVHCELLNEHILK